MWFVFGWEGSLSLGELSAAVIAGGRGCIGYGEVSHVHIMSAETAATTVVMCAWCY